MARMMIGCGSEYLSDARDESRFDRPVAPFAERSLQGLKAALAIRIEYDRFHVQHRFSHSQIYESCRERRKAVGPVLTVPGLEPRGTSRHIPKEPIAVELNLVQPLKAIRWSIHQGRQLHLGIAFQ